MTSTKNKSHVPSIRPSGRGANFSEDDWASFHDTVYEALDISMTGDELVKVLNTLPSYIYNICDQWGASDTVFGDEVYVFLQKNDPRKDDLNYALSDG